MTRLSSPAPLLILAAAPARLDIYQFRFTTQTLEGLMPMHGLYGANFACGQKR
jgi:hypothetical protein